MNDTQTVGRFQLISSSQAMLPASCAVGGEFSGKFIDFGFYIEGHGNVYICVTCFIECAAQLGYLPPEHVKIKNDFIDELQNTVIKLVEQNGELRDALATLRSLANPITVPQLPELDSVEAKSTASESTTKRKDRSSQQINEQRSKDVRSTDKFDDPADDFLDI